MLQVGFRQDEIKGRQLLHNNRPIMIKGVNRHMHEERRGKAVTEDSMLADIKLLKQLNFNAVRNAHYPNNNRWWACSFQCFMFTETLKISYVTCAVGQQLRQNPSRHMLRQWESTCVPLCLVLCLSCIAGA